MDQAYHSTEPSRKNNRVEVLLLIQPPVQDFYETQIRLQPLGLCYLKAAIRTHLPHIQCIIKDYHHGWPRKTIPLPPELAYLKDFYPFPDQSPFSTFHAYYHFGADFEKLAEEVAALKPDLVAISCLFSPYFQETLKTARAIKKRLSVSILAGGAHVSALPEHLLKDPAIDFIIRGEGERSLVEFLKAYDTHQDFSRVPNLGYKENGALRINPMEATYSVDTLPIPDFSDLPPEKYLFKKKPICFLLTSRGCHHHCDFCSVHQTFGSKFRRRSNSHILDEMRSRYDQGCRVFDFEDDNLSFDLPDFKNLCRSIAAMFPQKDIQLTAMNGVSYQSLDPEALHLMREAGFRSLNLALVSATESVRRQTRRPHTLTPYLTIVRESHRLGFQIVTYQILGLPGEPIDSMIQTLILNAELPVLLGASPFYLTPNTPIASRFSELTDAEIIQARLSAMGRDHEDCSRQTVYTLFVTTRILNFLKGVRFEEKEKSLKEILNPTHAVDKRTRVGFEILNRLLTEHRLYGASPRGLERLPKFDAALFQKVWKSLTEIRTQWGRVIKLEA